MTKITTTIQKVCDSQYKLIIFDLYKYLIKTYRKKARAALHAALHFPPTGFTCVWFKKDQH